jgi:hypothetical protein
VPECGAVVVCMYRYTSIYATVVFQRKVAECEVTYVEKKKIPSPHAFLLCHPYVINSHSSPPHLISQQAFRIKASVFFLNRSKLVERIQIKSPFSNMHIARSTCAPGTKGMLDVSQRDITTDCSVLNVFINGDVV